MPTRLRSLPLLSVAFLAAACTQRPEGEAPLEAIPDEGASEVAPRPPSRDLTGTEIDAGATEAAGAAGAAGAGGAGGAGGTEPDTPGPRTPDPGPAPTRACAVTKDSEGFFVRDSGKSEYVAFVPASYSPSVPMRAVVGMHGCGDDMQNFARWGVNPYATRTTQEHIGISLGGETGSNGCWSMGGDDDKVLAAVEDLSQCFFIDRSRVTIAGFSSGGQLAYRVGLEHADRFAGILIESASVYAASSDADALIAAAARKLPIAHRNHVSDSVFPIARVRADWAKLKAAGFPVATSETPGGHDGTSEDWATFLLPASENWSLP